MEEPVDGGAGQDGQHVLIPSQPVGNRERVDAALQRLVSRERGDGGGDGRTQPGRQP